MGSALLTIILGFLEGFSLIISPCILPILPIILAGSLTGAKKRPLGIIAGFTITFALFAFFSRKLVQYSGIDLNLIRYISYAILLLLGLIMLSNYLTEKFSRLVYRLSGIGFTLSTKNTAQGDFLSGFILGGAVAIVWTPCAGPILAAVIVQTVVQKENIISFFTLLAFALGAGIPMLIIAFYGIQIKKTFNFFKKRSSLFRKLQGLIIIASVGFMIYQENTLTTSTIPQSTIRTASYLQNGLWRPYPAPEISGITTWINSPPLQLATLKGKVVLIDFWTYSCINCIRTLPYLKNWYNQYHSRGLVIIGIHTPEFAFEKNEDNVKNAVLRDGILYPVALDNQFATWRNFANRYWPAHYLINKKGDVVYTFFGEGDYDVTENNIRYLLGIDELTTASATQNESHAYFQTAETYLGYIRADSYLSPALVQDKTTQYIFPNTLDPNHWALQGSWYVAPDKIIATEANAALKIHFNARKVFIVMGNKSGQPIKVKVLLNDKPLTTDSGADVQKSTILVDKYSIYEVVTLNKSANKTVQLSPSTPGLEIYTFTFGG